MIEERQRRYMGRGYHSIINVENHMFCRTTSFKESNVLLKEEHFQHHVTFRCENTYHIIIIIINLTPFELKAMRVSYKGLKLGETLLFT